MRLASYRHDGTVRHGVVHGDTVDELGDGDLMSFLHNKTSTVVATRDLADVELCAPIPRPGKLLAAAANYQAHVTETGAAPLERSRLVPRLFLKPSSAVAAPGAPIDLPELSTEVDWEAELGVVIGSRVRNVAAVDALGAVAGYLCANDVSARSVDYGFARDTDDKAVWFFDWLAGKWFDGFAPMGPWLVTADEVADPQRLTIGFTRNGELRQQGGTGEMIFTVAELIAHASRLMTLEPGDVLLTGTPAGVGAARGDFLKPGDRMAVTIDGLGTLENTVRRSS